MGVINPTSPTYTTLLAPTLYATQAGPRPTLTLDLRGKYGAMLLIRIGRDAATALTRPAYVAVRRTDGNTILTPSGSRDCVSSIAAVSQTTLTASAAIAATTMAVTSSTGFAARELCCAQLAGARCEFFSITDAAANVLTIDRSTGFRVAHNSADKISNGVDYLEMWLPGDDLWEITPVNNSGQSIVFAIDAIEQLSMTTS